MTARKIIATGSLTLDGLNIPVNIHGIANNFGRTYYTISPIGGYGVTRKEAVKVEHWETEELKEAYSSFIK